MNTKQITPSEYAKLMGCTLQNVTKKLRAGKSLPGVISVHKYGRFYVLEYIPPAVV